jgi:hypothetical protein
LLISPVVVYLVLLPFAMCGGRIGGRARAQVRQLVDLLRDLGRRR